jgi:hypothetical protein
MCRPWQNNRSTIYWTARKEVAVALHYLTICLEGLINKSRRTSARKAGVPTEIQPEHLPHYGSKALPLCEPARFPPGWCLSLGFSQPNYYELLVSSALCRTRRRVENERKRSVRHHGHATDFPCLAKTPVEPTRQTRTER